MSEEMCRPGCLRYYHAPNCPNAEAGKVCRKVPHDNPRGGYMHGADDDGPYDVDGVMYCGRCHSWFENCERLKAQALSGLSKPAPAEAGKAVGSWRCRARPDIHQGEGCCPHAEVLRAEGWRVEGRTAKWGTDRRKPAPAPVDVSPGSAWQREAEENGRRSASPAQVEKAGFDAAAPVMSPDEARECLNRFNNSHWNRTPKARYSIPVRWEDDDIRMGKFIEHDAALRAEVERLKKRELDLLNVCAIQETTNTALHEMWEREEPLLRAEMSKWRDTATEHAKHIFKLVEERDALCAEVERLRAQSIELADRIRGWKQLADRAEARVKELVYDEARAILANREKERSNG